MQILNRIKKAWRLSQFPEALVIDATKLSDAQIKVLSAEPESAIEIVKDPIGDGKAEFFGEPSEADQLAFEREEAGTQAWYDRLKNL